MSRIEMAFLEAILYCQQLVFGRVPPDLSVLEACGAYLYDASFPIAVFLEQDEAQAIDRSISHRVESIALFVGLQILKFCQVLYHVIKLAIMMFGPMEFGAFIVRPLSLFVVIA